MKNQGFSLIEVLVALILLSSILLNLSQDQWRNSHNYSDYRFLNRALLQINNHSELLISGSAYSLAPFFPIKIYNLAASLQLIISWEKKTSTTLSFSELKQELCLD